MDRVQGDKGSPIEGVRLSASPAEAPEPTTGSKHGVDPRRTKLADANAGAAAAAASAATVEQYTSYIRHKSAVEGGDGDEDSLERDTEKGYVGGDRVRLLVGRYLRTRTCRRS